MERFRPHGLEPSKKSARVVLAYKNFAANKGVSHIGLGVAALNTSRTLRSLGYWAEVWPAQTVGDIETRLAKEQAEAHATGKHPISHVVISAPWIQTPALAGLLMAHPEVQFAVTSHSNVGFLAADTNGIRLLREEMDLALGHHNFIVAGNSHKFCNDWSTMYRRPVQFLPNLYDVSTMKHVGQRNPWHPGSTLRLGVFGATRPLKNMVTATAAGVELAAQLRTDVEIWISSGREEGGGSVKEAMRQLTNNVPGVTLKEAGWQSWPSFRQVVAKMNALINVSYTESFNMVEADGIAEGVAGTVSEAIDWAPHSWVANSDNVGDVAAVTRRLIHDSHAVDQGQAALRKYVHDGSRFWMDYLGHN